MEETQITHPFAPLWNAESEILILGSLPSVKSRQTGFYYGHPRNRFWKMLAVIFDEPVPETIEEKQALILHHHLALWDVIASCTIKGSSDASIRNAVCTDLQPLLKGSKIHAVFCNGKKAADLYNRTQKEKTGIECIILPSTSPANAACSFEQLVIQWKEAFHSAGLL